MKKLGTEKVLSAYVAKKKRGTKEAFAVKYPCLFKSILLGSASFLIFFFILLFFYLIFFLSKAIMQEQYGLLVASEPKVLSELGLVLTGFGTNTRRSRAVSKASAPQKKRKNEEIEVEEIPSEEDQEFEEPVYDKSESERGSESSGSDSSGSDRSGSDSSGSDSSDSDSEGD